MKTAIIAGAGPAGLTAAFELLEQTDVIPIMFEESDAIGGISRTVRYNGNRMDIGGHRFFSKSKEVTEWWEKMMPMQGAQSKDDILLGLDDKDLAHGGPNPETEDNVMLLRHRVSRIFFLRKFFDYPISLKWETFANMGFGRTMKASFSFLNSMLHKRPDDSLENFYINRFGKQLYSMFFEDYTEKVWGVHPSKLGADWGSQRVKGLSVGAVLKDMIVKRLGRKNNNNTETSLIEQYVYPKFGPGHLWESVAKEVEKKGGQVNMLSKVTSVNVDNGRVVSIGYIDKKGVEQTMFCDYFLSTMPIKDLVASLKSVSIPDDVKRIASELPYRDFITVGLCVKDLKIKNQTKIRTYKERIPDTWIYIQERDVKIGRLQVFNNWSPYLVADFENTVWLGLEYFCTEGDELWEMSSADFIQMAIDELVKINIINREDVIDSCHVKVKKAYPAYFGSYYELEKVRSFLDTIPNLFCLGRNGQHRYNNMDHSMMTAMECVKNIKDGITSKDNIWNVNTEEEYHESK